MKRRMFNKTAVSSNMVSQGTRNNEVLSQSQAGGQERRDVPMLISGDTEGFQVKCMKSLETEIIYS